MNTDDDSLPTFEQLLNDNHVLRDELTAWRRWYNRVVLPDELTAPVEWAFVELTMESTDKHIEIDLED